MKEPKLLRDILAGCICPLSIALVLMSVSCDDKGSQPNNIPFAEITNPQDGSSFDFGSSIQFQGTGNDNQDGALSGSSLVWTSDKDGQIGTGTSILRDDLSVNDHIIVLAASDSDDNIGTDTINIEITATVTDVDGNVYNAVKIGNQWWMAENLKVTQYRNGDPIPHVTDGSTWQGLSTGAYSEYGNDPASADTYGRLYNWYAVDDTRSIAPEGWHMPSDDEWKQLEMYLGMSQADANATGFRGTDEGGKLKETGTVHWDSPNTGATNESEFTALPGGYREIDGTFYYLGLEGYFWSCTAETDSRSWLRYLHATHSGVFRDNDNKKHGLSVRCVRD